MTRAVLTEDRYRVAVTNAMEGIFFFHADTKRILEANSALGRLLGYSTEELVGLTLNDIIAHDPASIDANVAHITAAGQAAIGERRYRHRDGTTVPVEVRATALATEGGTVLCASVRDLRERIAVEAANREQETRLRAVVRNAPVLLFALDTCGVITFAAGRGLRVLGWTPEWVVGQSAFRIARAPETLANVRRALAGAEFAARVAVRGRVFLTHYAPQFDEMGMSDGALVVATDITAQVQAEAALERIDLGLTPQEQQILPYLAQSLTYRQIGAAFGITSDCVRKHTQHIAIKLEVQGGRAAVVAVARARGLLP